MTIPPTIGVRHLVSGALRLFFKHFYHGLAWTYDTVALAVSLGRWYTWVNSVLPFVRGSEILELAHGTGHLLESLAPLAQGQLVGLDESSHMERLARHRTNALSAENLTLVRGCAEHLPLEGGSFDSVVSTFPTEFIFRRDTIAEMFRVLRPSGRAIVLPVAWIVGKGPLERAAAWLFRVTRQVPPSAEDLVRSRLGLPLAEAGFSTEIHRIEVLGSIVLIVVATKPSP